MEPDEIVEVTETVGDQVVDTVAGLLEVLGDKLGPPAEYAFSVLVRGEFMVGVGFLIAAVIALVISSIILTGVIVFAKESEDKKEKASSDGIAACAILAIAGFAGTIALITQAVIRMGASEYKALGTILDAIR